MEWFFASQNTVGPKLPKKYFLTGKSRANSYNKVLGWISQNTNELQ